MVFYKDIRNSSSAQRMRDARRQQGRMHADLRNRKLMGSYMNLRGYDFQPTPMRFDLSDTAATPSGNVWTSVAENLKKITETAVPAYMQYRVFRENLKRSSQNQAPLDPAVYAPNMRVSVEPSAGFMNTAKNTGIGMAGLALAGVGLYLLMRRR